jgi:hypothetical protein
MIWRHETGQVHDPTYAGIPTEILQAHGEWQSQSQKASFFQMTSPRRRNERALAGL